MICKVLHSRNLIIILDIVQEEMIRILIEKSIK